MIGYYAHHVGIGHVHRAAAIAAKTAASVVGFSTRPAPVGWTGRWIHLPDDAAEVDLSAADIPAGGTLHWVPRHHDGLRARMGIIGNELARGQISVMVVDVSVEVAMFSRLFGVPVVVMAQSGNRYDRPHRLAYDLADQLLAPWPSFVTSKWPAAWLKKTVYLGALSRFDGLPVSTPEPGKRVLALWGVGGWDIGTEDIVAAVAVTADWHWTVLGPSAPDTSDQANVRWRGWQDDVWSELSAANVVVTHAGQNALAEVAAARRPTVILPQDRPHCEQRATAAALRRAKIGVVETTWPRSDRWPHLLERAMVRGGSGWSRWSSGNGAARAAEVLDNLATRSR